MMDERLIEHPAVAMAAELKNEASRYLGLYHQVKAQAEHLEVQNNLLLRAVHRLSAQNGQMKAMLVEKGLPVPPPIKLFDEQPPTT